MHTLARNKTTIWYALCTGKTELLDEYGNRTGQYELTYSEPQAAAMNIRWDDGAVRLEGFGLNDSGKRRMVTDDMNCPITIDSILWIGVDPIEQAAVCGVAVCGNVICGVGNVKPHNYVVSASPQKSLNHIVYIVEECNASKPPVVSA